MELNKNYFIVGFICLALGASLSFFKKPMVETREVIKYQIKEVVKTEIQKDTITKIKETKLTDGTTIKETEIVDKDKISSQKDTQATLDQSKSTSSKLINKHRIQLLESMNKSFDLETKVAYTYKVLNPVFIKGELSNTLNYNVSIGIELEF